MSNTHGALQCREVVRLKHVAHHTVRLALVKAAALATRHDPGGVLASVLQQSQPFVDLAGGMPLLEQHGNALLRYKGVLSVAGDERRLVFQGVLGLYGFDWDEPWAADQPRESVLVFIGDNLPEEQIRAGFAELQV